MRLIEIHPGRPTPAPWTLSSSVLEGPASKPVLSTPPLAKIRSTVSPVRRVVFLEEAGKFNKIIAFSQSQNIYLILIYHDSYLCLSLLLLCGLLAPRVRILLCCFRSVITSSRRVSSALIVERRIIGTLAPPRIGVSMWEGKNERLRNVYLSS